MRSIVWLALALAAPRAAAAPLTGPQILQKSAAAYAALPAYVGAATVQSAVTAGRQKIAQTATAVIQFQRPDKIRIEGKDVTGQPYRIVSDGREVWSAPTSRTNPGWQKMPNVQAAIIGMTGPAAGAPATLPALLLSMPWGNPFPRVDGSRRGPDVKIDGHACFQVVRADPSTMRSYWIDRQSFLLRRMKEEQNARQLSALSRAAALHSRVVVYSFRFDQTRGPLSPKLFQR
jgi:hypothetical protein